MPRDPKTAKKPYIPPSRAALDAGAAKARLQANGDPRDPGVQEMFSVIDEQLNQRKAKSQSRPRPKP
jgi:hypothetical protein